MPSGTGETYQCVACGGTFTAAGDADTERISAASRVAALIAGGLPGPRCAGCRAELGRQVAYASLDDAAHELAIRVQATWDAPELATVPVPALTDAQPLVSWGPDWLAAWPSGGGC